MVTRAVPVIALLVLAGCASKIDKLPDEAQLTVPEAWQTTPIVVTTEESAASISTDQVSPKDTSAAVENGWLNRFADEDLNNYVDIALRNNPDLWASSAQLKTAIEQVTVTGANLWPNLRAGVSSNRTDRETDGITTEIRTVSGTLEINWEADVWGKLTQRRRAAAYSAQAQAELYNAAELSLVANVSRAWFNLMTNKLQLDLAQQRLESFQNTAKLIEENYERGLRSALDVYLSRTDVQRQIANLSDSKFSYISSLRAFKTLLGEYPSLSMDFEAKLPTLTGPIPAGLPAELLTRRPDVKASQLLYKSEIANAKAANRDRFPTISFTGSIGDSRDEFNQLFDNNNMVMTLIGGIAQPIFQAGALKSREDQAYYQAESAYASLVKTTLNAFQEVENSLTREQTLREQHKAILEAVRLAQGGLDLALDRYQTGIENYTTVLQSQRSLFDSMLSEINIRNALLQNRISIHLALGGDFATQEQRADNQTLPSPTQAQASMESVEESEPATDTE
ncbi:NodT family efflux transporter outer membrane factor (OMF) lipoprotein [Arenicella xantha]|uniref:NodT family efflux transporter outer membrane factor (OMF) lipoprotein n=2 Tax=Arenicella xantha TaxID=644221 RepID=A0A395JKW6_9GAMM|nr:NodT family efflux transporter outer membrane factor (OMF) lipoprotein [Arenicella xantha]